VKFQSGLGLGVKFYPTTTTKNDGCGKVIAEPKELVNEGVNVVDVQTVSIVIASASVVAGVIYYILQIRHQTKIRQTDLVNRLYSTFISTEFMDATIKFSSLEFKDYEDYVNKYGPMSHAGKYGLTFNDTPELKGLYAVDNFFNQVGILLHRGLIDAGLVRDVFGYRIEFLWKKAEPLIYGFRKELNQPEAGKWFEYLYNEMKKREQRK
jgi:hypothetical protein